MKKLVLSLSTFALFIASIFVFASCEKEENTKTSAQNIKKSAISGLQYNSNVHNNALMDVYYALSENQNLTLDEKSLKILSENYLTIYLENTYNIPEYYVTNVLSCMVCDTNIDNILDGIANPDYCDAVRSIFSIFQSDNISYQELDTSLNTIEQHYASFSFFNQITTIDDVFRQSYLYWMENFENWSNLLSEPNDTGVCYGWVEFKKVVKGDVSGAVTGASAGLSIAGVGAIAGALIGAPFGSACAGIDLALDSAAARSDRARVEQKK